MAKEEYILELRILKAVTDDKGVTTTSEVVEEAKIIDTSPSLMELQAVIDDIEYIVGYERG